VENGTIMSEEFLHFLWKFRLLNPNLQTVSGENLVILHPGEHNTDSGPDFFNSRLKLGKTTWAGNVEIHVRASDWFRHHHETDRVYDNIILHVVYESDIPIRVKEKEAFQTVVIKDQFSASILDHYELLMMNHQWIPCYNQLKNLSPQVFSLWAPALAVERLHTKSLKIKKLWENCQYDWEETLYQHLASNFGFNLNNLQFELLAKSLPLKVLKRHIDNLFQVEALLFGQAGMLEKKWLEDYPHQLFQEYEFLRQKYQLHPIQEYPWRFLRLRPSNFPTIRIAQWAAFLHKMKGHYFCILEDMEIEKILEKISVCASDYWNHHYCFDRPSAFQTKVLGAQSAQLIMINGLIPFMYFLGEEKSAPEIKERSLNFLQQMAPEKNSITNHWNQAGVKGENALQTQALLELKQSFCDRKYCLKCRIGIKILAPI